MAETVNTRTRDLPVVANIDVLVTESTLAGVAAAIAAAESGARVLLISSRMYLGSDIAGSLRLWRDTRASATSQPPLSASIWGDRQVTTPLRVKRALEDAARSANVHILLGTSVPNLLRDEHGPAGAVLGNRAGAQVVQARTIIDSAQWPVSASLSASRTDQRCDVTLRHIVLSRDLPESAPSPALTVPAEWTDDEQLHYFGFDVNARVETARVESWLDAERALAEVSFVPGRARVAERPIISGVADECDWRELEPGCLRLGAGAWHTEYGGDPARWEAAGRACGEHASTPSNHRPAISRPSITAITPSDDASSDTTLALHTAYRGLRPVDEMTNSCALSLPQRILASTDVLVIGGGTTGASAALAAAEDGARVLVLEVHEALGGVGTVGLVGRPYHGRKAGHGGSVPFPRNNQSTDAKSDWFWHQIRQAGGEVWFNCITWGALCEGDRVRGVTISTPWGAGAVMARVVIDATGSADVAIAAGASYRYGADQHDIAMQGAGLPIRPPYHSYINTDYLLVDEHDMRDVTRTQIGVRMALDPDEVYDVANFIQTRERRNIEGEFTLSYLDQVLGRTFPDSVVLSRSDYDSHGYPSLAYFALLPHNEKTRAANHPAPQGTPWTPWRCLIPRGLNGVITGGLGISMHRDAAAMVRMQRDLHTQGYAAGLGAAMAQRDDVEPRDLDVKSLQRRLVELEALPPEVLTHEDSFPLPDADVRAAVHAWVDRNKDYAERSRALAAVFTHPDIARPEVQRAYREASGEAQIDLAALLGFFGEADGIDVLSAALDQAEWDEKILQGRMAEYAHLPTPVDAWVLALGGTGDSRALPPILRKLDVLDVDTTLSHHRSVALALERLADPDAAAPLAELLKKPGMHGHAMHDIEPLYFDMAKRRREGPLREIILARALLRCGDREDLGRQTLESYRDDLRGLLSMHATLVLREHDPSGTPARV